MKSFSVLLILSVFLVTPAVAQFPELPTFPTFDNLGAVPPAPSTPRWTHPAPSYNSSNNYGADFYTPSFQERTYTPPPPQYNHSLNNYAPAMPEYRTDGSRVGGPTFDQQFRRQEEQMDRIDRRNNRLRQTYQNQKPIACGPAYSPRARAGC